MNQTILNNINSVVLPEDTLYFLGDFAFGDKSEIPKLRSQIKCQNIIGLKGNHDSVLWKRYRDIYSESYLYYEFRHLGTLFCLFHYPINEWNEINQGSIMLHGHTHRFNSSPLRIMDVGVDPNNFLPVSIDQVVAIMNTRNIGNHHEHT